jgi:hydroxymethylglutaryl-CoA lyase
MGCYEVSLGDTLGIGAPSDIQRLLEVLLKEIPANRLAGHFHDTFGQGVANVLKAYEMGIRTFDSSVGGLGGCPYSPGAKGNVATEDIVYLFEKMGVRTGVDLSGLIQIGKWITEQIGCQNGSRAGSALLARGQIKDDDLKKPIWDSLEDRGDYYVHRCGPNIRITMNRPKNGNALTSAMVDGLVQLYKRISVDSTCFRIVLTATGKFFCTGMDLRGVSDATRKQTFKQLRELFDVIGGVPQTTLSVINGPAFGGGVGLAFASDIRLASRQASFQLTEVKLGIAPAVISKVICREWGVAFAREAMLSARSITAQELHSKIGSVHSIYPEGTHEAQKALTSFLEKLGPCAPMASSQIKRIVNAAWQYQGESKQDDIIEEVFDHMMKSRESKVGLKNFADGVRLTDWTQVYSVQKSKL